MSISKNRGQASLEMVVGLIILLVVAGVVIGLVFTTMNPDTMNNVGGGKAKAYIDKCTAYCETKDYGKYCSQTFKEATGSTDWNGDKTNARMFKDKSSVWEFCEDSVYCFLVTKCTDMDANGCRDFMCQQYIDKYGSSTSAGTKLQEIYKVSENAQSNECFREEKVGGVTQKTFFRQLPMTDNWLYKYFVSKQWCMSAGGGVGGQLNCGDGVCDCYGGETITNCPTDCNYNCGNGQCDMGECDLNCASDCGGGIPQATVTLTNCAYNSTDDSITCDTNCFGTVSGETTTLFVSDSQNMSMVMDQGGGATGTMAFAGGKVTAKPVDNTAGGVKLSGLNQSVIGTNTLSWLVALSCKNPVGSGNNGVSGVAKE